MSAPEKAQQVPQPTITLIPEQPILRPLNGGEMHSYTISVASGQYLSVRIKHRGIIILATLLNAEGQEQVQQENPSGGYGCIYLSAIAPAAGEYKIQVRSTEDWANPGTYEAAILELRPSVSSDRERIAAERSFAEGSKQFNKGEREAYQKARASFEAALSKWSSLHDKHWLALTRYILGVTHRRVGERPEAETCFLEALQIQLDEDDWRLRAAALNDLGYTYAILGKKEAALQHLQQALTAFAEHQDRRGRASALQNIAITHQRAGETEMARNFYEEALLLRNAEHDTNGELNIRNNLGGISDFLGEPYEALAQYTKALEGWQELDQGGRLREAKQLGIGFNNVAVACDRLNQWQNAFENYSKALKVFERIGDVANQAVTLDNIGDDYAVLGDPENALDYYRTALRLIETVKDPDATANILSHIGQAHISQGRFNDALSDFEAAQKLIPKPSPGKLANIYSNQGAVYSSQQKPVAALSSYEIALPLWRSIGDRRGEAATLQKRGEAYLEIGEQTKAEEDFYAALATWKALADQHGQATALNGIARVDRTLGRLGDALKHSEEAINISESLRTRVSSQQLRTSYFATQQNYYEVNIDLNMRLYGEERSSEYLMAAFEASERSRSRSLIDIIGESHTAVTRGVSPELLSREREAKLRLIDKERAQAKLLNGEVKKKEADAFKNRLNKLDAEYDDIDAQIRARYPSYANLIRPQPSKGAQIQKQLDDNTVLLEYSLGEKRSYVWAVTPDSIKGVELPARQVIEGTSKRLTSAIKELNRDVKDESHGQWNRRRDKSDAEYAEASAELSKMLIEPVTELLENKRLLIVADGALQVIPFASLPAPKNSGTPDAVPRAETAKNVVSVGMPRMLIQDHEIINLASASVLAVQRRELGNRKSAPFAVAVVADPVFDPNDPRLKEARRGRESGGFADRRQLPQKPKQPQQGSQEGQQGPRQPTTGPKAGVASKEPADNTKGTDSLARVLRDFAFGEIPPNLPNSYYEAAAIIKVAPKGQWLEALNFRASRATAMSPELSKYRIVHFATHGMLDMEHPELSGLLLSTVDEKGQSVDGYLRLHDIYNLNLPADLVVLSACETGVGKQIKGEGLIALTRGFMYAGAKSVVASLWKVDDAATRDLMAEFYKQMFTNKLKPAAALQQAQIALSKTKRWHSPYYWAGFVIQGDWQ